MLGRKRNILNLLVTLVIITGLMIAGPVSAVRLDLKTDKAVYHKTDDTVTIFASVDIERGEIVPVKTLKLRINDNFKVCEFNVDGSSSCPNISITLLNSGLLETDDLDGKGFGFENPGDDPSVEETNFGFGYGFGMQKKHEGLDGELLYEIKWKIAPDSAPNGKYQVLLEAFAQNGAQKFTYLTKKSKKFNIKLAPSVTNIQKHKVKVHAEENDIDHIGDDDEFNKEDATFDTELTQTSNGKIGGRTSLNLYTEMEDGSIVRLQLQMNDHTALEFTQDRIEIEGRANIKYQKNTPGEDPIRFRDDIEVSFVIENGKVEAISVDPTMPFNAEFVINRFEFD